MESKQAHSPSMEAGERGGWGSEIEELMTGSATRVRSPALSSRLSTPL